MNIYREEEFFVEALIATLYKKGIDKIPNNSTILNKYISCVEETIKTIEGLYNSSGKIKMLFSVRFPLGGNYSDFMSIINVLVGSFEKRKYDTNYIYLEFDNEELDSLEHKDAEELGMYSTYMEEICADVVKKIRDDEELKVLYNSKLAYDNRFYHSKFNTIELLKLFLAVLTGKQKYEIDIKKLKKVIYDCKQNSKHNELLEDIDANYDGIQVISKNIDDAVSNLAAGTLKYINNSRGTNYNIFLSSVEALEIVNKHELYLDEAMEIVSMLLEDKKDTVSSAYTYEDKN